MLGLASFMKRLPRLQYALALLCSSGHGVRAVTTDMDAGHASVSSGCHTSSSFSFYLLLPWMSSPSGLASFSTIFLLILFWPIFLPCASSSRPPLTASSERVSRNTSALGRFLRFDYETSPHCHQLCSCLFNLGRPHACLSGKWTAAIGRYTLRRTAGGGQCFGRTRPGWEWSEHTGRVCRFASFRRPLP